MAQPGGVVTTLHEADLPLLRAMMPLSLPSIPRAVIELPREALGNLAPLLPADMTFGELIDTFSALAKVPRNTVLSNFGNRNLTDVVEPHRDILTLTEACVFGLAPVNHRDPKVLSIYSRIIAAYCDEMSVDLEAVLRPSSLIKTLKTVEETLAALPPLPPHPSLVRRHLAPPVTIAAIPQLESLHKALVLYLWLSYRFELAFPDRDLAAQYKERTENVLEMCLERMPGVRPKKTRERSKRMDMEHELYRRTDADKQGLSKPGISWVEREAAARKVRRERFGLAEIPQVDAQEGKQG